MYRCKKPPNTHPASTPIPEASDRRRYCGGPNLRSGTALVHTIMAALNRSHCENPAFPKQSLDVDLSSAVLFLLGEFEQADGKGIPEPCLILNKRSQQVRQPGDLCCPGGGIAPTKDALLASLLHLPGFPLRRWPHWLAWRRQCPAQASRLARLLATGLREAFEEMRLNPWMVTFLGPLPPQPLRMFRRVIYPMAVWIPRQQHFTLNWEVASVVRIPLRRLLQTSHYARFRLQPNARRGYRQPCPGDGFPLLRDPFGCGFRTALGRHLPNYHGFSEAGLELRPPAPGIPAHGLRQPGRNLPHRPPPSLKRYRES